MSRSSLRILVAVALLLSALTLVLVHVPEDSVLLSGNRVLNTGWRIAPLWRSREFLLLSERRTLHPETRLLSDSGEAELSWKVELEVAVELEVLESVAAAIQDAGDFGAYLTARVTPALRGVLEADAGADPLLPEILSLQAESIRRDLAAVGLTVSEITVELGDTDSVRRFRRRQARAMIRPGSTKVMIIGLDGADWQIIDPLLERGKLPSLARLLRRGVRANLRSNDPMLSPLLWTTAATGKAPEEHGIIDFLLVDPDTGKRVPMSSRFRKVKALWNILTDLGLESDFIAWWATWPAERVRGTMVTDRVSYSLFAGLALEPGEDTAGLTFPPGYMAEVKDKTVAPRDITFQEVRRFLRIDEKEYRQGIASLDAPPSAPPEAPVVAVSRVLAAARTYHGLALDLLAKGQPDLFAVYYEGIDQIGHRFQHAMPPRMSLVNDEEFARYGNAVTSFYEYQDELLGELLEAAEPETTFLVLSDHGFRNGLGRPKDLPPYVSEKPGFWHRRYGIFALSGPGVGQGTLDTVTLYDITPTVLHLLGLPSADDMPGRALTEALTDNAPESLRLASYEGFGDRHQAPATTAAASAVEKEMIRELTALGYLSAPAATETHAASEDGQVTANYHLNLASILAGQGRYDEAEREARAALEMAPIPDAFRILSQVLERKGDLEGSIRAARRALKTMRNSNDATVDASRLRLVGLLLDASKPDDAAREIESFQDSAYRNTAEGLLAERQGRTRKAVERYRAALDDRPVLAAAMERLYRLLPPQELQSLAPRVDRALSENDQLAPFHNVLGVLRKNRGDLEGAVAAYRQALALEPDRVDYLTNLGAAETLRGHLGEALAVLEQARRKAPDHPEVWLNLGSVHGKAGRTRQSLDAFARAKELGARGPAVALGQALGHAMLGELDTARTIVAEARGDYPDDPTLRQLETDLR